MNFQFPEDFIEGKTVIRVGRHVEEFVELYNSTFQHRPGVTYEGYNKFNHMIERYGDELAISCNYLYEHEGLGWGEACWYESRGAKVIDFTRADIPKSVDVLSLL